MVKWQTLSVVTVSLFVLLGGILNFSGVSYSDDGDKTCTDCYSEIKVKSTYWEIKVENAGDKPVVFKKRTRSRTLWVNLDAIDELVTTDPKVKVEILVPTISKYAIMKHPDYGYLRPLVSGNTLIKRNTKARPSPSRIILHGQNITGTVKWNFDLEHFLMEDINIDPIWNGVSLAPIEDCKPESYEVKEDILGEVTKTRRVGIEIVTFINQTHCTGKNETNSSGIGCLTTPYSNYTTTQYVTEQFKVTEKIGDKLVIKSRDVCRTVGYELGGESFNFEDAGYFCKQIGFKITCDSIDDGNGNGKCTSGESCIEIDFSQGRFNFISNKIDSPGLKRIDVK